MTVCGNSEANKYLEHIVLTLNNSLFKETPVNCYVTITPQNRERLGISTENPFEAKGELRREIKVNQSDVFNKEKNRIVTDIMCQMINFIAGRDGVKASNHYRYVGKKMADYYHKYGIITDKNSTDSNYGNVPIACNETVLRDLDIGDMDFDVSVYEKKGKKHSNSSHKYIICPKCKRKGRVFTKEFNVICGYCNVNYVEE